MDWITIAFVVAGVLLIASEAVHLSLIPVFLGAAALIVAGARGLGLIDSVSYSLLMWSLTSVALALPLRPILKRSLGKGAHRFDRSDEDRDALGEVVEVAETTDDASANGRIRFRGTTWTARTTEGTLQKGARAKLFAKDGMTWVIEPLSLLDETDNRVPVAADMNQTVDTKREK